MVERVLFDCAEACRRAGGSGRGGFAFAAPRYFNVAEANALLDFLVAENGSEFVAEPLPDESLQTGADLIVVLGTGYQE